MATVEFIEKRLEGKKKELDKLNKKLERILKAQESNWENNPYYYGESDLRSTKRDIERAENSIKEYEDSLSTALEKANSRNVQVIIDFLNDWKEKVKQYHLEALPEYLDARKEFYKYSHEYSEKIDTLWRELGWEGRKQLRDEFNKEKAAFAKKWGWIASYVDKDKLDIDALSKDLDKEANVKYDNIIERTNAIVGTITDASNLRIGDNGELNGFIIGDKGTAKVTTIGAGGYNIQCFHFRVLVKKVK